LGGVKFPLGLRYDGKKGASRGVRGALTIVRALRLGGGRRFWCIYHRGEAM